MMLRFHKMNQTDLSRSDWEQEPLAALLPDGKEYLMRRLAAGDTLFIMYDGEKPVGLLEMDAAPVGEKPKCARVGLVVLLPEYRRHGLGRMLMCLAAGEAVERQLWFLAGTVPETEEAEGFAKAIHMRKTEWFSDLHVLDLSDVEGLRHG